MSREKYIKLTAIIFAIIAFAHLARLVGGWRVTICNVEIPVWASAFGVLLAGVLAWSGFKISK